MTEKPSVVATLFRFQSVFGLLAVFVAAIIFSPRKNGAILFISADNLANVVRAVSEIGIIAVGMTFVILIGGIDLSVGAVLGLAAVGSAVLMVENDWGFLPSVLLVLVIGLIFGALQGVATAMIGIQSFIVTLAGLQIARGLARIWSGGQGVAISYGDGPHEAPASFALLGERTFGGLVPIPVLIFAVIAIAAVVFLRVSAFSRHLYAVGGNEKAARLSGVPVVRVKIAVFAICGLLASLAGIVHAVQLNQGSPNDGIGYELDAIAAVVIGGTSLAGGRGSVAGTVAGALLLGVLNNILALNNIDSNIQLLIKGLVIVAAAALVLASCGTTSDRTGGSPSDGASKACKGADGKYTIGMSQANVAEPYRQRMDDDIRAAAKEVPQFDVKFADAAQDNAKQVADVENYITQQIDLLIISPNEAKPLTAVVKKAFDKGIPVIVLDRKVEGDGYTGFIGGDNVQIGSEAGKYVAEKLLPNGGNIVELKGLAGATPQAERHQGFVDAIKANPKIKIVADASGDWLREKGQAQMDALLKANPKIDVVYAHNDPMAEGAYLAAKAVGREKEMKFIGIDALPIPSGGIKAVEQGRLSATFTYPTNGKEAIAAAKKILVDCGTIEKSQILPTRLIDKENAATIYAEENPNG